MHNFRYTPCDIDDWKDETVDDGYQYTAPVGSYGAGASPYGALDMAGNVWEWTSTLWGGCYRAPGFAYPYQPDDGREELEGSDCRVVRGGSWLNDQWAARSALRWRYDPSPGSGRSGWDYSLGVRVVVASR